MKRLCACAALLAWLVWASSSHAEEPLKYVKRYLERCLDPSGQQQKQDYLALQADIERFPLKLEAWEKENPGYRALRVILDVPGAAGEKTYAEHAQSCEAALRGAAARAKGGYDKNQAEDVSQRKKIRAANKVAFESDLKQVGGDRRRLMINYSDGPSGDSGGDWAHASSWMFRFPGYDCIHTYSFKGDKIASSMARGPQCARINPPLLK